MSFSFEEYIRTLTPIVVPCFLIPVSSFRNCPRWYRNFQKEINPLYAQRHYMELDKNFVFSKRNWEQGRFWTAFTYMFRHNDFGHLRSNMFSLIFFSKGLVSEIGNDYYLIFYGSGIIAALDSTLKVLDISYGLDRILNDIKPIPKRFSDSWLSKSWDNVAKKVSNFASPFVSPFLQYMGASAGIYGIIGATLCSDLFALYELILYDEKKTNLGFLVLDIASIVYRITYEYELHQSGEGFVSGVDTAGHITGFVVGIILYILLRWRRQKRRN